MLRRSFLATASATVLTACTRQRELMQGLGSAGTVMTWRREYEGSTLERAVFLPTAAGWRIDGDLVGAIAGAPVRTVYSLYTDPEWAARSCVIEAFIGGIKQRRILSRRGMAWYVNGLAQPALTGCDVVDLGFSPSTNTAAINRLSLETGRSAEVDAVHVDFPKLGVSRALQRYTRKASGLYEYQNVQSGFTAPIEVDASNRVFRYGDIWQRLAIAPADAVPVLADGRARQFADALVSAQPSEFGAHSADFDWAVGGWTAEVRDYGDDGSVKVSCGEWWFSWVLEGRAIQDVWIVPPRGQRRDAPRENNRYGSTVRWLNNKDGLWHIVWVNPVSGVRNELSGGKVGDALVLEGPYDGTRIRWSFIDITPTSFRWTGEQKTKDGIWRLGSEFVLQRLA